MYVLVITSQGLLVFGLTEQSQNICELLFRLFKGIVTDIVENLLHNSPERATLKSLKVLEDLKW